MRSSGRRAEIIQFEVDYLFKTIIALPNVTFALAVYEASEPELTTVQDF